MCHLHVTAVEFPPVPNLSKFSLPPWAEEGGCGSGVPGWRALLAPDRPQGLKHFKDFV